MFANDAVFADDDLSDLRLILLRFITSLSFFLTIFDCSDSACIKYRNWNSVYLKYYHQFLSNVTIMALTTIFLTLLLDRILNLVRKKSSKLFMFCTNYVKINRTIVLYFIAYYG